MFEEEDFVHSLQVLTLYQECNFFFGDYYKKFVVLYNHVTRRLIEYKMDLLL